MARVVMSVNGLAVLVLGMLPSGLMTLCAQRHRARRLAVLTVTSADAAGHIGCPVCWWSR
ncbi:MAG: hypothetical protein QM749_04310 [Aquabacterium sp.]